MNQHRFALALCALVSSLLLADVANAYPTTSSGSLSKALRPIEVGFNTLVEGTDYGDGYSTGPKLTENGSVLDLVTLVFEADWTPSPGAGYDQSVDGGVAGVWVFELDPQSTGLSVIKNGDTFTVSAQAAGGGFGTFTYLGGFVADELLPQDDTPLPGDVFKLFTPQDNVASLEVTLLNGRSDFVVALNGELVHVGPFVVCADDDDYCESSVSFSDIDDELCGIDGLTLDMTRNFEGCEGAGDTACGRVTALNATSVPEPGTLALFGLGLASLGIRFRRRKALLV